LGVLTFTTLQATRAWAAFQQAEFINRLPLPAPALYYQLSGIFWSVVGLVFMVGLFTGPAWYGKALAAAITLYLGTFWVERLWLGANAPGQSNTPFLLMGTGLCLIGIILWLRSRTG
jgi:uncharacterized membrane protein YphA (DoxX/SURF4 family)